MTPSSYFLFIIWLLDIIDAFKTKFVSDRHIWMHKYPKLDEEIAWWKSGKSHLQTTTTTIIIMKDYFKNKTKRLVIQCEVKWNLQFSQIYTFDCVAKYSIRNEILGMRERERGVHVSLKMKHRKDKKWKFSIEKVREKTCKRLIDSSKKKIVEWVVEDATDRSKKLHRFF